MTTENNVTDLQQGEALKERGMELSFNNHKTDLGYARMLARKIASERPDRTCSADQVQALLIEKGIDLGNAAGTIFKEPSTWAWTGEFRKSERKVSHSRLLRVWRLL